MTNDQLLAEYSSKNEEMIPVPLSALEIERLRRKREDDEVLIAEADDELAEAKASHKLTVAPLKTARATAFKEIRSKVRKEVRTVYYIDNQETEMMESYVQGEDGNAIFVGSRRLLPTERQQRIPNSVIDLRRASNG